MPAPLSDEDLMLSYRAGDLPAFRELYRRHSLGLYRFIAWRCPRQAWVDEIVQDAWASLHAARAGYQPQAAFRTYLYQIARHRLIDILRQREALPAADLPAPDGQAEFERLADAAHEGASPEASLEQKQRHALLHAAIRALPGEQREALVLQQFSGMSIEEIGVVTAASAETVKSRLRYAMQKLRARLQNLAGEGASA
ncbi:sigma-70 family RNA polymerase sigma factor [Janthinobacterium fluminis]|uniref:Sigma-70 family RNA polymerase sigma factor n=1 Tax=Janthinobacterium fluminis TaxID=2987524 RepID=A0ABT5K729_9BURK|nr:sigma-70 family RNA polymerase sigma factor [Janthinobacterium fluminis]MDC8759567.1 sigma-70 family RNA polymerase sigma factor [Janthinobacterium fluminis]